MFWLALSNIYSFKSSTIIIKKYKQIKNMIRHHLTSLEEQKQNTFQIDEKKLVKTFIYRGQNKWIQYFTGFLFMQSSNSGKVDLKIRFSRHPHLAEIQAGIRYPLQLFIDDLGLYTLIEQQGIRTVQKPQQNLLYLKIGHEGKILAISFHSKIYCKSLLQHLTLALENNDSTEMTWTEENLSFLNQSMKENLMYVDSVFILQERVLEFCNFFNRVDKKLYEQTYKNPTSEDQKYMVQFFQIIKHVFLRANRKIIITFIQKIQQFETVLKCLSYNPFGTCFFNYLLEFDRMTVISNPLSNLENEQFLSKYSLIVRVKFLRDVAICTFTQNNTDAVFNQILNDAYINILQTLGNSKFHLMQKLQQLAKNDEEKYLCVFAQIWDIFKSVLEDAETIVVKEMFYLQWVENGMFSQTLSAIGRILRKKLVEKVSSSFWHKLFDSMNPMLSYQWAQTQTNILSFNLSHDLAQTFDLMSSLVIILADCGSTTKILVLDFVRVQIQISQNRKHITARYLSYLYNKFIMQSYQHFHNQDDIQKYIEFIIKIYIAEPIRTRHFLLESNLMTKFKDYFQNKFVFIMLLKLFKTFIERGDICLLKYLQIGDFYDCLKYKYEANKKLANIISSLFLSIFKAIQAMTNKQSKQYLSRRLFLEKQESARRPKDADTSLKIKCLQKGEEQKKTAENQNLESNIEQRSNESKRSFQRIVPTSEFQDSIDMQN